LTNPGSSVVRKLLASPPMLAALACVFLGAIDLTVVASILPHVISDLGVNTADIDRYIWAVNAYLISYIVAIPIAGAISDRVGRVPTFAGSLLVFLVGSIVCAMAGSLGDLIVGRAIQGFGGGGLLPVAIALTGDTLGKRQQLAGIGFVGAVETIGWVVGPIYGAVMTETLSFGDEPWRMVFWINVPILAMLLFAIRGVARHDRNRGSLGTLRSLDWLGAILLSVVLATVTLALASGGELGASTGSGLRAFGGTENPVADRVPILIAVAAISGMALLWWEHRVRSPLLPLRLYRLGDFRSTIAANFLIGVMLMTVMVNVPLVVALGSDRDSAGSASALVLAPFTIAIAVASVSMGALARVTNEGRLMVLGVLLSCTGLLLVSPFASTGDTWAMVPGLIVTGIGIGMLLPPLGTLPIQIGGEDERGAAAASALTFRLLGMTIGISLLTSAGVWRLQVLTNLLEPVVQEEGESTALFLVRQQAFILDHAIPLSRQVIGETFFVGSALAALMLVPVLALRRIGSDDSLPSVADRRGSG